MRFHLKNALVTLGAMLGGIAVAALAFGLFTGRPIAASSFDMPYFWLFVALATIFAALRNPRNR